nr:hypothetical protein [Rickettsia endosymbiont of Ceutorhynchus assimilis]
MQQCCFDEGIIKDIDIKSNAYKAGLRNKVKVIGYDFPKGSDTDQIVTVKTTKGEFNFRPESSNKKEIYQFKAKLSEEDKIKIKKFFGIVN